EVFALVPLLSTSHFRLHVRTAADLVPLHDPDRFERPRVVEPAIGGGGTGLSAPRQLHHLGGRCAAGAATARCPIARELAEAPERSALVVASDAPAVVGQVSHGLLLVAEAVGVGQRRVVPEAGRVAGAVRQVVAARSAELYQCRRLALS